jgi:hypothetical protein
MRSMLYYIFNYVKHNIDKSHRAYNKIFDIDEAIN